MGEKTSYEWLNACFDRFKSLQVMDHTSVVVSSLELHTDMSHLLKYLSLAPGTSEQTQIMEMAFH